MKFIFLILNGIIVRDDVSDRSPHVFDTQLTP